MWNTILFWSFIASLTYSPEKRCVKGRHSCSSAKSCQYLCGWNKITSYSFLDREVSDSMCCLNSQKQSQITLFYARLKKKKQAHLPFQQGDHILTLTPYVNKFNSLLFHHLLAKFDSTSSHTSPTLRMVAKKKNLSTAKEEEKQCHQNTANHEITSAFKKSSPVAPVT